MPMAVKRAKSRPPTAPSQVFFGLKTGVIGCRPTSVPCNRRQYRNISARKLPEQERHCHARAGSRDTASVSLDRKHGSKSQIGECPSCACHPFDGTTCPDPPSSRDDQRWPSRTKTHPKPGPRKQPGLHATGRRPSRLCRAHQFAVAKKQDAAVKNGLLQLFRVSPSKPINSLPAASDKPTTNTNRNGYQGASR